jgi:CheY-like chemotaxis protein/HPt (histidine-containing phosphotransfer) domain-containing protein
MLLDERAQDKDLLLSLVIDPDIPPFVRSDPTRLRQIVLNLLGNAIKFTEKGEIRLSVRALGQSSDATELEFVVSDTGPGIAPETMARLFQKFEQADSSTTRRFGGTGLGLSICKDLLQLMGGTIEAQSKVGEGSTFRFRLELAHGERPVSIPEDGWMPQSHSHQLRVLCAEDGPTNQIIIRSLLEEMGHVVEVVEDGLKAIQALSERDFDVVLMDGRMPYMDGQEAALKIRAGGTPDAPIRSTSIPIIALTANASKEGRSLYLTSGMNGFLSKPIIERDLFEELEKVIRKALDSGRSLPTLKARPLLNNADMSSRNRLFCDTTAGLGETITPPIPPGRFEAPGNTQGARAMPLNSQMTSIFIEEAPRRMKSALEALKAGNSKDLALEMHTLKSSVSYFKMQTLQSEFDRLEQKAESGQLESLESDLDRIDEMLKEKIASLGNFADSEG